MKFDRTRLLGFDQVSSANFAGTRDSRIGGKVGDKGSGVVLAVKPARS